MGTTGATFDGAQAHLISSFDKSVTAVRAHADVFERDYGRPAVKYCGQSFHDRPITSTFIAMFALLSFFPVITFLGFSFSIAASFVVVALLSAFVASIAVILFFASILFAVLVSTFFVALFLTALALTSYASLRLFLLIRNDGTRGVGEWVNETRTRFVGSGVRTSLTSAAQHQGQASTFNTIPKTQSGSEFDGNASDESAIIVKTEHEEAEGPPRKYEVPEPLSPAEDGDENGKVLG